MQHSQTPVGNVTLVVANVLTCTKHSQKNRAPQSPSELSDVGDQPYCQFPMGHSPTHSTPQHSKQAQKARAGIRVSGQWCAKYEQQSTTPRPLKPPHRMLSVHNMPCTSVTQPRLVEPVMITKLAPHKRLMLLPVRQDPAAGSVCRPVEGNN
jgi:hypothetical protein